MDQFEAAGAGHRLEERGLKAVDAVLGSQHGSALACGRGRHEPEDMAVFARDLEGFDIGRLRAWELFVVYE